MVCAKQRSGTSKRHLPPRLRAGSCRAWRMAHRRVAPATDHALEIISHGDARFDTESLGRFVTAYQTVTALTLGSSWTIPIMLRSGADDECSSRRRAIAAGRVERNLADAWTNQMMEIADQDLKSLIRVVADMARSGHR